MMTKLITNGPLYFYSETFGNPEDTPCLLIAGAGASSRFWTDRFCTLLVDQGFFVIRYDHRDQGLSSAVDFEKNPYTVADLAEDALAILDAYKAKRAHVVGHSMGGTIAQYLSIHHPTRLLSFTSISVANVGKIGAPPKEVMDALLENKPSQNFDADLPGFMRSWELLNGDIPVDQQMAIDYTRDFYERSKYEVSVAWNHIKAQERFGDLSKELKSVKVPAVGPRLKSYLPHYFSIAWEHD